MNETSSLGLPVAHSDSALLAISRRRQAGPRADIAAALIAVVSLVVVSHFSFLWFHTLVEFFSATAGIALYVVARNTAAFSRNGFLLFLAQGFFWAAVVDLVHALSYGGMGTEATFPAGAAAELWLVARFLEAGCFVLAPVFIAGREVPRGSFAAWGALAVGGVAAVFVGVFPVSDHFATGGGLTPFKIVSEYLIVLVLVAAGVLIHLRRRALDHRLYWMLETLVALTCISELAFTSYINPYGGMNVAGHVVKFLAFYLLLYSVSRFMLTQPLTLLARDATSFDAIPTPVLLLDQAGRVLSGNPAARHEVPEAGAGMPVHQVWHDPGAPEDRCTICKALHDGKPAQEELYTPARRRWYRVRLQPLTLGSGRLGFVCTQVDITDRKEAVEALRRSEEQLRQVIRVTRIGIFDHDHAAATIYWSPEQRAHYGFGPDDPVTLEAYFKCVHPDDVEAMSEAVKKAHDPNGDGRFDVVHRIISRDGQLRWLDTRSQTFFAGEGAARHPVRTVGAVVDVSAKMQAEEAMRRAEEQLAQSQKLQALGQLVGGVAHDFNNLLTVIAGNAEFLADSLQDQHDSLQSAHLISEAATRAANLTRQLLAFSRRQQLSLTRIDLKSAVRATESLLRRTLGETIASTFATAPDAWPVYADQSQLESALLNLAINARDAMPHGGTLTVKTENVVLDEDYVAGHPDASPGEFAVLTVEDSGTGIAPEVLPRVFDPFFTTKGQHGTGLGLSMVYGFVKQSGGHVTIYSEQGHGTCVKLYLPRAADQGVPADRAGSGEGPVPTGTESILVVEDEPLVQKNAVQMLKKLGYRVQVASTGPAALEIVRSALPIDLLFTDAVMPGGMNGRELAKAAEAVRPGLKVLYTSGYSDDLLSQGRRLEEGILLLNKPYRRIDLARMVRQALER